MRPRAAWRSRARHPRSATRTRSTRSPSVAQYFAPSSSQWPTNEPGITQVPTAGELDLEIVAAIAECRRAIAGLRRSRPRPRCRGSPVALPTRGTAAAPPDRPCGPHAARSSTSVISSRSSLSSGSRHGTSSDSASSARDSDSRACAGVPPRECIGGLRRIGEHGGAPRGIARTERGQHRRIDAKSSRLG